MSPSDPGSPGSPEVVPADLGQPAAVIIQIPESGHVYVIADPSITQAHLDVVVIAASLLSTADRHASR